jgi:autophagy-related protein 18
MLFSTSLVALILSPRRLQIKNTKRESIICELTFPTTVLAVRLNRKRLVIVLEDQIYLYDIQTMKLLYTIETSPNPMAICALSPSSESCYLAYPLPQKASSLAAAPPHAPPNSTHVAPTTGEVLLFDAVKLEAINVVEAHRSPLSSIAFNNEGTIMATASDKGTIIRVFSVPDAHKLYQFRRGSMPSRIFSMAFNITSTLLCVSSATETVHIFKLGPQQPSSPGPTDSTPSSPTKVTNAFTRRLSQGSDTLTPSAEDFDDDDTTLNDQAATMSARKPNGTFFGLIRRTSQNVSSSFASTVGGYLPKGVAEMWEPARDFAWIRLPKSASGVSPAQLRSVVAMSPNSPQVMVVTNEGNFYVFSIDLARGGEGTLVKQYS